MKNILGLKLGNYGVIDFWLEALGAKLDRCVPVERYEGGLISIGRENNRLDEDIVLFPKEPRYIKALDDAVELDERLVSIKERVIQRKKRGREYSLTEKEMRKIKYVCWELMGNNIPANSLNGDLLHPELNRLGYSFHRVVGGRGWYFGVNYVGGSCYEAYEYSESFLGLGNRRLDFV